MTNFSMAVGRPRSQSSDLGFESKLVLSTNARLVFAGGGFGSTSDLTSAYLGKTLAIQPATCSAGISPTS